MRKFKLDNLYLDGQNPRLKNIYEPTQQSLILKEIVETQGEKLFRLMKDILLRGKLNPIDKLAILKNDDKYIVLEGNRRVASLKILNDPEIIKNINPKIYNRINKLNNNFQISEIEGILFDKREDANQWISLKHTGENNGAGLVTWTSENKTMFDSRISGKKSMYENFIELFKENTTLNKNILDKISNLKSTNLKRLLSDKRIKETIGIDTKGKKKENTELNIELMDKMMYDQITRNPKVSEIYTTDERIKYIEKIMIPPIPKYALKNKKIYESNLENESKLENRNLLKEPLTEMENKLKNYNQKEIPEKTEQLIKGEIKSKLRTSSRATSRTRSTLIPMDFSLRIKAPKANGLFRELKKCKVNEFTNLVSCSFRVFIELSVNYYLMEHNLSKNLKFNLIDKIKKVIELLKENDKINDLEFKALKISVDNQKSFVSIALLNSVVHGEYSIDPNTLKIGWDNYQILFEKIYE